MNEANERGAPQKIPAPMLSITPKQQLKMLVALWLLLPTLVLSFYLLHLQGSEMAEMGVAGSGHGGRERTLAMQVGISSLRLVHAQTTGERDKIRLALAAQLRLLETVRRDLMEAGRELDLGDSGGAHMASLLRLDRVLGDFIRSARALAQLPESELTPRHPLLIGIQSALDQELIGSLEAEVQEFRQAGKKRLEWFKQREIITSVVGTGLFALFLVFITVEAFRRRAAEKDLHKTEQRYQDLVEGSIQGILVHRGSKALFANQAFAEIFGFASTAEVLSEQNLVELLAEEDREGVLAQYGNARRDDDDVLRFHGIRKDGGVIWVEALVKRVVWEGSRARQVTVFNITRRKQAEEERARLAAAMEQSGDAVFITDVDGIIRYVNKAFESITGYTREEAIGVTPGFLEPGERDGPFSRLLMKKLRQGGVWKGRYANRRKDGSIYQADATHSPIRDASGEITNFVCVQKDVTRQIEMEEQLKRAQRMEAIGGLAGGIAHDFNNMLTPIIGFTELLLQGKNAADDGHEELQQVLIAANRAKELISQIMVFSRTAESRRDAMRLQPVVAEAMRLLRATLPTTILIEERIAGDVRPVVANSTQINQILMNLCVNASHAMPGGGRLEVSLQNVALVEKKVYLGEAVTGHFARLRVRDDGDGMDGKTLLQIFEPFFTTKEAGKGTGLGLASVFGAVSQHGGYLDVASAPGKGTTFDVYLPVTEGAAAGDGGGQDTFPAGGESILLVDDEHAVSEVTRRILEGFGYKVTALTDSRAALAAFRQDPHGFDLVLTDQNMPGMAGSDLAAEILALRRDIPVVLCTGFSESITADSARELGIAEFVLKPIASEQLGGIVRRALDGVGKSQQDQPSA